MNRIIHPLATALLLLIGAAPPVPSPNEYPVAWWHDHQAIEVFVGDRVTVRLECRPGSGCRWREAAGDPGVLAERTPPVTEVVARDDERGEPGGRTVQVFRYAAKGPGLIRWSAVYAKGPGARPEGTFQVEVRVWERRRMRERVGEGVPDA